MKKYSLLLCLMVILTFACIFTNTMPAEAATSGDYEYEIDYYGSSDCRITKYIGTGVDVVIPDSLGGYNVKSITYNAFSDCSGLKSVTIPKSVAYFDVSAFTGCSALTAIYVDSGNTYYSSQDGLVYNFDKSELICVPTGFTSVTVPSGVTAVSSGAFLNCKALTAINVESGNTNFSSQDGILYDSDKSDLICFPDGLTSITIPSTVTAIRNGAFSGSGLTDITIPGTVKTIGVAAFASCSGLKSIIMENGVESLEYSAFANCSVLSSVTIPNSVTYMNEKLFESCKVLTSVTIENGATTIGSCMFQGCTGLTSLTIPDSVKTIGSWAFMGTGLTSITIPSSVTTIKDSPFMNCNKLTEIKVDEANTYYTVQDGILYNIDKSELICYPAGISGNTFSIPNSVTTIAGSAFDSCSNLSSITIPSSVTTIKGTAFRACSTLTSVTIPDSVAFIGWGAFQDCTSLASVYFDGVVNTMDSGLFYNISPTPTCYCPTGNQGGFTSITMTPIDTKTITVDSSVTNGTITLSSVSGMPGEVISLKIIPEAGFRLKVGSLKYNDSSDHSIVDNSFTMGGNNITVYGEFEDDTIPTMSMTTPSGINVELPTSSIVLGFSETVKAVSNKKVTISDGTNTYSYTIGASDNYISGTGSACMATIPISSFSNGTASLSIDWNTTYTLAVEAGAYVDEAGNETVAGINVGSFKTEVIQVAIVAVSATPSACGVVNGGGTYNKWDSVTVVATANSGYSFVNWTEDGSPVSASASYTFTLGTTNRTLVANFAPVTHTVSVSADITAGGSVNGGGTYNEGDSVTVTATTNSGYSFVNWTEDGSPVSASASYTFTLGTTNRTLVANFAPVTHTVSVSADTTAGGSVNGGGTYNEGDSVTVTAIANSGYSFVNWTEDGSPVSASASYTFTLGTSSRTLVANFTLTPTATTTGAITGTITDGSNPVADATVSLTAGGSDYTATSLADGTYTILIIPAGTGYSVTASKKGYNSSSTTTSVTANTITQGVDLTLSTIVVEYTVTFKDWDGTVLKSQTVGAGKGATAPSNPTREGYLFTGWDKAFDSVTSNITITAQYSQNQPATLLSIAITTPASILVYTVGDSLDISGMVVTGTYSDGTTKMESITAANISGFDSSSPAAIQILTVTVGGKTTTYTITIKATTHNNNSDSSSGSENKSTTGGSSGTSTGNTTPDKLKTTPGQKTTPVFSDMNNHKWAWEAVETLAAKGIVRGTSETTFAPGKNITRADFISILVKALGLTADFTDNFADIRSDDYYYQAAGIAKKLGIASGTGDGRFNPKSEITRQDMMVLVVKALKAAGVKMETGSTSDIKGFKDASNVSGYASEAVAALIKKGIIKGSGNAINPKARLTRAEAAVVIYKIYSK